jgi:hypothetical protein
MSDMHTYSVLTSETLAGLVVDVNAAMHDGWRCVGGPFLSLEDGMCQAMQRDPNFEQALKLMHDAAKQLGLFNSPAVPVQMIVRDGVMVRTNKMEDS